MVAGDPCCCPNARTFGVPRILPGPWRSSFPPARGAARARRRVSLPRVARCAWRYSSNLREHAKLVVCVAGDVIRTTNVVDTAIQYSRSFGNSHRNVLPIGDTRKLSMTVNTVGSAVYVRAAVAIAAVSAGSSLAGVIDVDVPAVVWSLRQIS